MRTRTRLRRFLLLCAIDDARGYPTPVFVRPMLNRIVNRLSAIVRQQRTARRYHRSNHAYPVSC
jgi:hypothetical protein